MRGAIYKFLVVIMVGAGLAGCQSPGAVGALQSAPYGYDLLSPASTKPAPATSMPNGQAALPPPGYISFCLRFADQCTSNTAPVEPVAAAQVWPLLNQVNMAVNAAIKPEDDLTHYGRPEYWTIPSDGYGDCEDYALTKRQQLAKAGIPLGDLNIAIVKLWDGERHAVLTVSTELGDYVLDNLNDEVRPWNKDDYVWIERMSPASRSQWASLGADAPLLNIASNSPPQLAVGALRP